MTKFDRGSTLKLLLFGGFGSIGESIQNQFKTNGWRVIVVSRSERHEIEYVKWDPIDQTFSKNKDTLIRTLTEKGPFDAVCWAQGTNSNDSVYDFDTSRHEEVYKTNVLYIINSLNLLLKHDLLRKPARLCIISSIWQNIARQTKLSYCVSKAALRGLVLSAAVDLARDGHVINAVLPGVLDTPMTHAHLEAFQLEKIRSSTLFGRLATLDEVAICVLNLSRPDVTAITGQFITVDLGYTSARLI